MAKPKIPTKVIQYKGVALQFIVAMVLVQLEGERRPVKMTADELLLEENGELLEHLLEGALNARREVNAGYKKNAKGEVLDTDGKVYKNTWKKGAQIAHNIEVRYGAIFKAAIKPTLSTADKAAADKAAADKAAADKAAADKAAADKAAADKAAADKAAADKAAADKAAADKAAADKAAADKAAADKAAADKAAADKAAADKAAADKAAADKAAADKAAADKAGDQGGAKK